jgi:outer membrane receptor protein involved in Fe transport
VKLSQSVRGENKRRFWGRLTATVTAEWGCKDWKWWLNNTTITLGMQNVTDEDPPFVAGAFENGYDESLTTIKGRFWYVGLKKRF